VLFFEVINGFFAFWCHVPFSKDMGDMEECEELFKIMAHESAKLRVPGCEGAYERPSDVAVQVHEAWKEYRRFHELPWLTSSEPHVCEAGVCRLRQLRVTVYRVLPGRGTHVCLKDMCVRRSVASFHQHPAEHLSHFFVCEKWGCLHPCLEACAGPKVQTRDADSICCLTGMVCQHGVLEADFVPMPARDDPARRPPPAHDSSSRHMQVQTSWEAMELANRPVGFAVPRSQWEIQTRGSDAHSCCEMPTHACGAFSPVTSASAHRALNVRLVELVPALDAWVKTGTKGRHVGRAERCRLSGCSCRTVPRVAHSTCALAQDGPSFGLGLNPNPSEQTLNHAMKTVREALGAVQRNVHATARIVVYLLLCSQQRMHNEQRRLDDMKALAVRECCKYIRQCEARGGVPVSVHLATLYCHFTRFRQRVPPVMVRPAVIQSVVHHYANICTRFHENVMKHGGDLVQSVRGKSLRDFVCATLYMMRGEGLVVRSQETVLHGDAFLSMFLPEANRLDDYEINKHEITFLQTSIQRIVSSAVERLGVNPYLFSP